MVFPNNLTRARAASRGDFRYDLHARAREKAEGCMKKKGLFLRPPEFRSLPTLPADCDATKQPDDSFRQALTRARQAQAEIWAEEVVTISDAELETHEHKGDFKEWSNGLASMELFTDIPSMGQE